MNRALAFAAGVALDATLGDPPTRWHPVGLLGAAVTRLHAYAPASRAARLDYGLAVAAGLPLAAAGATALARELCARIPLGRVAFEAVALDAASALRTLLARASEIEVALGAGDLEAGRRLCGMHLVSRDTSALSAAEVAGATIESVAENLSDGVVAPWLAFALGGAPGAAAYRAVNTLDSRWGYRSEKFEALGGASARLDDALNIVPSRLTALALIGAATIDLDADALEAAVCWRADAGRTASPNAGHPMAAMAGALRVRLEKRDTYVLGGRYRDPAPQDVGRAVRLAKRAATLVGAGLLGALVATGATR